MTKFKCPHNLRTVEVYQHMDGIGVVVRVNAEHETAAVYLDPADAPAIALAVLEAAGVEDDPDKVVLSNSPDVQFAAAASMLRHGIQAAEAKAAAAAEEAARGKRRDELAREFTGLSWSAIGAGAVTHLINTLIDTENELAKERAK